MVRMKAAELFETRQITLLALKCFPDLTYDSLYMEIHKVISSDNGVVYIVLHNDALIAFAHCELQQEDEDQKGSPAILRRLCVEEEYRRKKIATRLAKECARWAKKKGCSELLYDCIEGYEEFVRVLYLLNLGE